MELSLLAECNSNCVMCYAANTKRENDSYLSVEEYKNLWQQASMLGAFTVTLSGGEPTLRSDLFDIISVLDPGNTIVALVTNSLNLNEDFLKDLKSAGVGTIHFSLDGSNELDNDSFRRIPGHFKKVIESINIAKKQGFTVCLSTIIMHNGMDNMKEMVKLATETGTGIVFSPACLSGRLEKEKDVLLTRDEWEYMLSLMKSHSRIRCDFTINLSMRQECPGGREKIGVSCYGDVSSCGMNPISFGNIREESLQKIWRRMHNFPDFKKRTRDCLIAVDYEYIDKYVRPLLGSTVPVSIDRHPVNPISFEELDSDKGV
ncbi:MAG: radical SAM/SPASM domain-containing protein [bacterium]